MLTRVKYAFQNYFVIKSLLNQRISPKYENPSFFNRTYTILGSTYKPYSISRTFKSSLDTLTIQFQDGLIADYFYIWLRDSCKCKECVDTGTFQKKFDTVSLNLSITPTQCHLNDDGKLKILWPDVEGEHTSYYDPSWLYRYGLGFYRHVYERVHDFLPPQQYWNEEYLSKYLPEFEYDEVMQSLTGISKVLVKIHELGIVIIRKVPCKSGEVVKVMNRISHVKNTRMSSSFNTIVNGDADGDARDLEEELYVAQDVNLHTDKNYLEKSPGLKIVHCLERKHKLQPNSTIVEENCGKSYFVDGIYVAKWLKENYPLYFTTLAEVPVKFKSVSENMFYINYQPMLTLNKSRDVTEVHYNNENRAPLEGPSTSIMNFYAAYKLFGENIRKSENQFSIVLKPGDMIILNNRRILHGNTDYDTSEISTYFEACYADIDDILARYRSFCKKKELNMKL